MTPATADRLAAAAAALGIEAEARHDLSGGRGSGLMLAAPMLAFGPVGRRAILGLADDPAAADALAEELIVLRHEWKHDRWLIY